jgi:hypothetical protein
MTKKRILGCLRVPRVNTTALHYVGTSEAER